MTTHYLYDANNVRYELAEMNEGKPYNWLFLPGGPGADSSYFKSLTSLLHLPGNTWLIDLPGNGSNHTSNTTYNFDKWVEIFPQIIEKFPNPILVGHSFGGSFPLLFPSLEKTLKGLVILHATPTLWLEEAVSYSKQFNLPDLSREMHEFTINPCQKTFDLALQACIPYYFPKKTLERGRALLTQIPFQFMPAVWWQRKAIESNFSATWIPQKVPTLIIGARYDCICPFTLFEKDTRFKRPNITMHYIDDAGHLSWVENPTSVSREFKSFMLCL